MLVFIGTTKVVPCYKTEFKRGLLAVQTVVPWRDGQAELKGQ